MENKNSYTVVGLFFVICIILIVVFILWFTASNNSNNAQKDYYIVTKELPKGVKVDSEVKFLGVSAGSVTDISFSDDGQDRIIIELSVKSSFPILDNSIANVDYNVITGMSTINITKGEGVGKPFLASNKRPIIHLGSNFLNTIGAQAEDITQSIDDIIRKVSVLLSNENLRSIDSILSHSNDIISNTNKDDVSKKISETLNSLNTVLQGIDTTTLNLVIKNSSILTLQATKTLKNIDKGLDIVNRDLQKGDYNLKSIVTPALYQSQTSLISLNQFIGDLKSALFRLENNPYSFFFSSPEERAKTSKGRR